MLWLFSHASSECQLKKPICSTWLGWLLLFSFSFALKHFSTAILLCPWTKRPNTLMSKNAFLTSCPEIECNDVALGFLTFVYFLWEILLTSRRIGSFLTSTHTSLKSSEVISHTSFCLNVIKPPFLQDRACVTSNDAPQIHWVGILSSGQLYLILMPSENSCFVNSYPSYLMGKFVNQFKTLFRWRVSIILFSIWCWKELS